MMAAVTSPTVGRFANRLSGNTYDAEAVGGGQGNSGTVTGGWARGATGGRAETGAAGRAEGANGAGAVTGAVAVGLGEEANGAGARPDSSASTANPDKTTAPTAPTTNFRLPMLNNTRALPSRITPAAMWKGIMSQSVGP